jgi:hypothetical protein
VVAEKAGVKLSPAMQAASSRRDGGGERARLPAFTATDEGGRVQGFQAGSYARKGAKGAPPSGMHPAPPPAPAQAAPRPSAPTNPPPGAAQPSATPRAGAMRFSSLSGFRRR